MWVPSVRILAVWMEGSGRFCFFSCRSLAVGFVALRFFDIFLRHLRWMVEREVDWPVWVVLGRSWGLCVRSWATLGAYLGGLGVVDGKRLECLEVALSSLGII